jgi:lipopolysaccharide/colanic/teichoic acid biosynthesis glycosyltransferase
MIIIELLFWAVVFYVAMILILMITSKGECFFCGHRFTDRGHKIAKIRGRKWCGCNIKKELK